MKNKIKVIALFGEAGSGKDYLLQQVAHWDRDGAIEPIFNYIVKSTTRPKRENEIDGVHYHFINEQQFFTNATVKSVYRGWYYGIEFQSFSTEKPNLVVLDIKQIQDLITNTSIDVTLFKIAASPKTRMLRQLNREQKPDVDEINRRYLADKEEYSKIDFNYIELQNETLEDADKALLTILRAGADALAGKND